MQAFNSGNTFSKGSGLGLTQTRFDKDEREISGQLCALNRKSPLAFRQFPVS